MASGAAAQRASGGDLSVPDRLSALPDELLHSVLSFLPAPQVVQTTVLSKRWTNLWRSVPSINLDFRHFQKGSKERWPVAWGRMENFASNLLVLHNAPWLDAFRFRAVFLRCDPLRHVDRWVRRAIEDNPLVLELSVISPRSYQLPHLSSSPCRRLKSLQLTGISLDNSFEGQLRSCCPELEHLVLQSCKIGFCCIESDKLKNLVVKNCEGPRANVLFVVRASSLTSLCLDISFGTSENGVSLDAGNLLMQASIAMFSTRFSSIKSEISSVKSEIILLGSLFNVISLELEGFQFTAMLNDKEFNDVPVFGNLRTLSLTSCFSTFRALWRFMQKSPYLEKLTLRNFHRAPIIGQVEYAMLGNLRTLTLDKCSLHVNFLLLHHLLQKCPNLEKLNLHNCTLPDGSTGAATNTHSWSRSLALWTKLTCTEITHGGRNNANILELVGFLLKVTARHNAITVKRI